jgi:ABC-type glycerol-3-phosphate transport system permease component
MENALVEERPKKVLGRRRKFRSTRFLLHAIIILFIIVVLCPLLYTIKLSLQDIPSAYQGYLLPTHWTLDHYPYVLTELPTATRNLVNSIWVTIATVILVSAVSVIAGYALVHLPTPGKGLVLAFLVGTLFFPTRLLSLIGIYQVQKLLGLQNETYGLIFPYVSIGLALSVLIMRSVFEQISVEITEAAYVDGANSWYTLWHIMFPLVKNGLVVIIMVNFVVVWGEYLISMTLIDDMEKRTFPVVLTQVSVGQAQWSWPRLSAMYIVAILPGIVGFIISQRWYMKGLTEGAIKM